MGHVNLTAGQTFQRLLHTSLYLMTLSQYQALELLILIFTPMLMTDWLPNSSFSLYNLIALEFWHSI